MNKSEKVTSLNTLHLESHCNCCRLYIYIHIQNDFFLSRQKKQKLTQELLRCRPLAFGDADSQSVHLLDFFTRWLSPRFGNYLHVFCTCTQSQGPPRSTSSITLRAHRHRSDKPKQGVRAALPCAACVLTAAWWSRLFRQQWQRSRCSSSVLCCL